MRPIGLIRCPRSLHDCGQSRHEQIEATGRSRFVAVDDVVEDEPIHRGDEIGRKVLPDGGVDDLPNPVEDGQHCFDRALVLVAGKMR